MGAHGGGLPLGKAEKFKPGGRVLACLYLATIQESHRLKAL